jgi:hypothetical protein
LYVAAKPQAEAYPQLRRYMRYMCLLSFTGERCRQVLPFTTFHTVTLVTL